MTTTPQNVDQAIMDLSYRHDCIAAAYGKVVAGKSLELISCADDLINYDDYRAEVIKRLLLWPAQRLVLEIEHCEQEYGQGATYAALTVMGLLDDEFGGSHG